MTQNIFCWGTVKLLINTERRHWDGPHSITYETPQGLLTPHFSHLQRTVLCWATGVLISNLNRSLAPLMDGACNVEAERVFWP